MKINKDQITFSRWKKLKFDYNRARGHLFGYAANRFRWHYYPRLRYVSRFPDHVDIEISSACNMHCPMCYTTTDEFKKSVKKKFMDFELFKKIIDECAAYGTYSIRISLRGEPFLHRDVIKIIRYAKQQGVKEVSSLTNNLALTPELFTEAMQAGLDWLTISFDGLGKTYEWIRQPAKFDESYQKVKEYKRIKESHASCKPVIKIQTVWPAIRDCAREYFELFNAYVDDIAINPLVDYLHNDQEIEYVHNFECPVLYQRLVIGSDGTVLLCSNDEFAAYPLGNAGRDSLFALWHGPALARARELHRQHRGVECVAPCKHCYLPRKTQPVVEQLGTKKIVIDKYLNRPEEIGK